MKAGIRVAATLFTAALFMIPAASSPADDPAALRLLAERIAAEYGSGSTIELDVATVAQLPIPLTFPPEARVVGSVVQRPVGRPAYGTYRYTTYHVYLDATLSSESLVQAIASSAAAAGYKPSSSAFGASAGGFVIAPTTTVLCKDGETTSLSIRTAGVGARAEAIVVISVPAAGNSPLPGTACSVRQTVSFGNTRALPVIRPSDGVRFERRSNFSGNGFSEQTVDVFTSLGPAALLGTWAKQLGADGWAGSAPAVNAEGGVAVLRGHGGDAQRLVALTLARVGEGHLLASIRSVEVEPSPAPSGR
jgi:hypothetical protein